MSVQSVYETVAARLLQGVMVHSQYISYFDFLCLPGYRSEQEYHYKEESKAYHKLLQKYMCYYNKLLPVPKVESPEVIPIGWYDYTRMDVTGAEKREFVKAAYNAWVMWEQDTKRVFEKAYTELVELGDVASACEIKCLVKDVSEELGNARQQMLLLDMVDYDLNVIYDEQS